MKSSDKPNIITLNRVASKGGVLSSLQADGNCPMEIKRSYWIYDTDEAAARGNHVHLNSSRILVCLKGSVEIILEDSGGAVSMFHVEVPHEALFIPAGYWINLTFTKDTILLVFASCLLEDDIMIKSYQEFKNKQMPA